MNQAHELLKIMRWYSWLRAGTVGPETMFETPRADGRSEGFRPRLTYAITPPSQATPSERRAQIAARTSALALSLPIDALLVYDVQDEAARNPRRRPFPFAPKVDSLGYAQDALELGALPLVVYRAVSHLDERALCAWLRRLAERGGRAVFVGAPTREATGSLPLGKAYELARRHEPLLDVGGVVIPERHAASGQEVARVWDKASRGCRFFVSQTVWSVRAAERLIIDGARRSEAEGVAMPPLLFTVSPCGSPETLEFLTWLGVDVPPHVRRELLSAPDMLRRSIELSAETYAKVRAVATAHGMSVGCNVESVSSRPAEVAASVELLHRIRQLDSVPASPRQTVPHPGIPGQAVPKTETVRFAGAPAPKIA